MLQADLTLIPTALKFTDYPGAASQMCPLSLTPQQYDHLVNIYFITQTFYELISIRPQNSKTYSESSFVGGLNNTSFSSLGPS
jgi:hypothetical protein